MATLALEEQLSQLFGSYKAEWLGEHLFELFTEPAYFPELTSQRPCVIIGGRGTGKTTVLRCMSYQGQFALQEQHASRIADWSYYGFYHRVNTNRVTAFRGPELPDERWTRTFAHYMNLLMCDLVAGFLLWYRGHVPRSPELSAQACSRVSTALCLTPCVSADELADRISRAEVEFEAYINNVADSPPMALSMQGAPVDTLLSAVCALPQFSGKSFLFLMDEYENLLDYQQRVVNTLIKHSGPHYTFKIAVREEGWRERATVNPNERLISPADYERIDIAEKLSGRRFTTFASRVCNRRLARLQLPYDAPELTIERLLPGMPSEEAEAEHLDRQGSEAGEAASLLAQVVPADDAARLTQMPLLEKYFLVSWARTKGVPLGDVWRDHINERSRWQTRYENYRGALLYTLRRGRRGIRRYYCGWRVFEQLAASNIRYFLELVVKSLLLHTEGRHSLTEPVTPAVQTRAAQEIGRKNLSELEGLSVQGAQLSKLVLGMGRVLQVMAADPAGHTPEANQFHLSDTPSPSVSNLLSNAVMHLALLRFRGSKLTDDAEIRDYDYMVHPIFSAYFVFSYRHKRKMMLPSSYLQGLVEAPRATIRRILGSQGRDDDEPLPDQLRLFEAYYHADP